MITKHPPLSTPAAGLALFLAALLWATPPAAEVTDLAGLMPVRAAYGEQLIARWLNEQRSWRDSLEVAAPPPVELTDELRENLRALGYLR